MSHVILPRIGILAFMAEESRREFATYGTLVATRTGQVLIREGEVNRRLYVVLSGVFNVTTLAQGQEVHLDTVGVGDCLGEVSIFHPDKASATVMSAQVGQLWSIDSERLQEFLLDRPADGCAAILGINIILSRRLKRANGLIRFHQIVPSFLSVRAKNRTGTTKLT